MLKKNRVVVYVIAALFIALIAFLVWSNKNNATQPKSQEPQLLSGPITEKDFALSDGTVTVKLDTPYKDFVQAKQDIKNADNLNAEVMIDDVKYVYYTHKSPDFPIQASNVNWNFKNRSKDDLYIAEVAATNEKVKTPRGIGLGMTGAHINDRYGPPHKISQAKDNRYTILSYTFKDMELNFTLSSDENKITDITMRINAGAAKIKQ